MYFLIILTYEIVIKATERTIKKGESDDHSDHSDTENEDGR